MSKVQIYTDGSARGNPDGPGGYGAVLHFTDSKGQLHEKELSAGYKKTTNNRMELMAAIVALEALNRPCEVDLYSDSKYLTDAFNQHWIDNWVRNNWKRGKSGPVKNIDLWERLLKAKAAHRVNFIWVKGHAGHPLNERCDQLATAAADGSSLHREGLNAWCSGTVSCRKLLSLSYNSLLLLNLYFHLDLFMLWYVQWIGI